MAHKILIVDDEPHIIRSLGFVLEKADYDVTAARNGTEALRLVKEERPDLVFLDIMMPEPDGYEVCRRIKSAEQTADVYVIMLTAKGQEADRRRSLEVGADEYMTKPFSPSRAVERVRKALGQSELEP
jgi:DNA-binding response OmpR family regulator